MSIVEIYFEEFSDRKRKKEIVRWFRDVHTNSEISICREDTGKVYLINEGNKKLEVSICKTIDVGYMGDVKLKGSVLGNGYRMIKGIEFEIRDTPYDGIDGNIDAELLELFEMKCYLEQKIADMYIGFDRNIAIPWYYGERLNETYAKKFIFMMLFELKGLCFFETMDDLTMIRNHIIREIYPGYLEGNQKENIERLNEGGNRILPEDIKTVFPTEMTIENIIKLMGIYHHSNDNGHARVVICNRNVEKTVIAMKYKQDFVTRFIEPIRIQYSDKEPEWIQNHIVNKLEEMVLIHELGHHVFRNISQYRTENERETLANWFASMIMEDDYCYRLAQYLIPYQGEIYQDFIKLPTLETLEESEYKNYCDKIYELTRSE